MNTFLQYLTKLVVVLVAVAGLGCANVGQDKPAKKSGYDPTGRTTGWVLFQYSFPEDWKGSVDQEYAILRTKSSTKRIEPIRVRAGLWAVDMMGLDGWEVECVGMVLHENGASTLTIFSKKSWSHRAANELRDKSVQREAKNLLNGETITYDHVWFAADLTDSELEIEEESYVE